MKWVGTFDVIFFDFYINEIKKKILKICEIWNFFFKFGRKKKNWFIGFFFGKGIWQRGKSEITITSNNKKRKTRKQQLQYNNHQRQQQHQLKEAKKCFISLID